MNLQAGPFQYIGTAVAEPSSRRIHEARSIEPMIDVTLVSGQVAVTDPVRKPAKRIGVGWVGIGESGREELAGLQISHPNGPPSPDDMIQRAVRVVHEPSAPPEGQLPNGVEYHPVPGEKVAVPQV